MKKFRSRKFERREKFNGRTSHNQEKIYMYGRHALEEALAKAPHTVKKVFLSPEASERDLRENLSKRGIPFSIMKSNDAAHLVGKDASHQGVIAVVDPTSLVVDFSVFKKNLKPTEETILVLLDELTDPHNVGAVIRSAAAFGASGVLIPEHRQAPVTGAVVKVSAGMVFSVPLVSIGNVNYAIQDLKEMGFKTYGLVMNGSTNIADEPFDAPALFIVGNEGRGIREKTLELCDVRLRIPMDPVCESLNASVSAAVVLYAWSAKHLGASKS
ncbi:23S rRNA (guanosine(2251)-2'-O)-methyltransferase RlmB [Patescibacteria group bacterium]|nr:23S rRNA (guanosine(2251)-2'-O)-methyltransferase RlmB [Patescibacteria group bacterium]MCL5114624.1 23S rRNA (guanosine(2251)-2'-O)-methyltransferase RlmB [Patescibacteria group bacterium]